LRKKPYTPLIPLEDTPIERDSQGLIDAVKAEFFPDEVGPWYTVALCGQFDSANGTEFAPPTDLCMDFACLAGLFVQAR